MIDYDARSWLAILFHMRGSVLPRLLVRIGACAAVGGAAAGAFAATGWYIPPFGHTLVGVALGLLLVFRTNTAYDRFWEGRRLFGLMVNRSRDLARQAMSYVDEADDRATLVRHIQLTYALIRQHVRRERDLGDLGPVVADGERAALEPVACRPNVVMRWISDRLAGAATNGRLSEHRLALMDQNLTTFADCLGGAERILKTPIPFAYAQHIKSFLALFCFSAPFAMAQSMGWTTPIGAALIAFALFGIDEIGVEIEDPFGYDPNDLPLDRIGETIAGDTRQLLDSRAA
jgi:putative membrane protein